jgi:hypothetical protein
LATPRACLVRFHILCTFDAPLCGILTPHFLSCFPSNRLSECGMDFLFLALIFAIVGLSVGLGAFCEYLRSRNEHAHRSGNLRQFTDSLRPTYKP